MDTYNALFASLPKQYRENTNRFAQGLKLNWKLFLIPQESMLPKMFPGTLAKIPFWKHCQILLRELR